MRLDRLRDRGSLGGRELALEPQSPAVVEPPPPHEPSPLDVLRLVKRRTGGAIGAPSHGGDGDSPCPVNQLGFRVRGGEAGQLQHLVEAQAPALESL